MEVSIIIPFYSGLSWLYESIESVFKQTYKNYEVILINDGSKEDLTEFLGLYSDKIIYRKIENSGPGIARNIGIDLASGKYLAFLDSDDMWLESKLEEQVHYMNKYKIKWSHTSYETFSDKTGELISKIDLSTISGFLFKPFLLRCPVATPCVMIERKFLSENNLKFSPEMRYGQDYFLWLNAALLEEIGVLGEVLTRVRIRGGNAAKKAYCQIYVKAKINEYITTEKGGDLKNKVPGFIRIIFTISSFGLKLINNISQRNEMLSKIIYAPVYVYTKLIYKLLNGKKYLENSK